MFVCCLCCVLSGRGLCDELITRPRGVLLTVARCCVWSKNLVIRGGHSPRWAAEPEIIIIIIIICTYLIGAHRGVVVGALATYRKVADSILDGVSKFYHWHNPSGRTMALWLTQPLTEMSTRNISWG
jgi:hypothetical protein